MASSFENLNPQELLLLKKMFSTVQGEGALASAFTPPEEQPGPNAIPKLEPMPIGHGSWFNRPYQPASVQTLIKREAAKTADLAGEQQKIAGLIKANPIEFMGLTGAEFNTVQEAQNYLKIKQAAKLNESKLQETIRKNKAQEEAARKKAENPFLTEQQPKGPKKPALIAEGQVKTVGGKNFRRVNGAWQQE